MHQSESLPAQVARSRSSYLVDPYHSSSSSSPPSPSSNSDLFPLLLQICKTLQPSSHPILRLGIND